MTTPKYTPPGLLFTEPSEIDGRIFELTTIVDQLKATSTSEKQLSQELSAELDRDEAAYMEVVKTRRIEGIVGVRRGYSVQDSSEFQAKLATYQTQQKVVLETVKRLENRIRTTTNERVFSFGSFSVLPVEIMLYMFNYLEFDDVWRLSQTSKKLRIVCFDSMIIWKLYLKSVSMDKEPLQRAQINDICNVVATKWGFSLVPALFCDKLCLYCFKALGERENCCAFCIPQHEANSGTRWKEIGWSEKVLDKTEPRFKHKKTVRDLIETEANMICRGYSPRGERSRVEQLRCVVPYCTTRPRPRVGQIPNNGCEHGSLVCERHIIGKVRKCPLCIVPGFEKKCNDVWEILSLNPKRRRRLFGMTIEEEKREKKRRGGPN